MIQVYTVNERGRGIGAASAVALAEAGADLVLVGIRSRGVPIAQRLAALIEQHEAVAQIAVELRELDVAGAEARLSWVDVEVAGRRDILQRGRARRARRRSRQRLRQNARRFRAG